MRDVPPSARHTIPLFPLATVLLPGAPLPLHVFEDRYRTLIADLLEREPGERSFGVVAIREGREVGDDGVRALYDVGCLALVREARPADDGTYDIDTIGTTRFRLLSVDSEAPYLRASVEWVGEPIGEVGAGVAAVVEQYARYRQALGALRNVALELPDLPSDPRLLSYLVAATVLAEVPDRQAFLAEPEAGARLAAQARWLRRETALLTELSSVPAGRMLEVPSSLN